MARRQLEGVMWSVPDDHVLEGSAGLIVLIPLSGIPAVWFVPLHYTEADLNSGLRARFDHYLLVLTPWVHTQSSPLLSCAPTPFRFHLHPTLHH